MASALRRTRLGLIVGLVASTMLFVSFTSVYIMRRGLPSLDDSTGSYISDWLQVNLPTGLLLVNTLLLLLSSITVELARRQITRQAALAPACGPFPGFLSGRNPTFPGWARPWPWDLAFLAGQWMAWRELGNRGFLPRHQSEQFHGLCAYRGARHSPGGRPAGAAVCRGHELQHKPVEDRRIVVDVTAWYWHFMALVWLYIFALLEFVR